MDKYKSWLENDYFDEETKKELISIKDDEDEIRERFYQDLEFGTGGLRGVIGYGTNRMNRYTVAKATQGLANYVLKTSGRIEKSAAISFDSRIKSEEFAMIAARVLSGNGIKTYVFDGVRPTPEASFAVRALGTDTGVMITASHNPPEYNGYKAYGNDGSQYCSEDAKKIIEEVEKIGDYSEIKMLTEEEGRRLGLIETIGKELDDQYISKILDLKIRDDIDKEIKIVYTPLHGVGGASVLRVLEQRGFKKVYPVEAQLKPDGTFPTVSYPNPEDIKAFEYAKRLAEKVGADIVLATDPDSDRVAVLSKSQEGYKSLTGNQTGALLMDYILRERKAQGSLPSNGMIVKTIVSSKFADRIAAEYGLGVVDVLTGFKNIAMAMREMEQTGEKEYVFGYEESIGYLPETFVRDKDAVSASMLIAEMAALYKKEGKTLVDKLEEIYEKYGYFEEKLYSITMSGQKGRETISRLMDKFRKEYPKKIGSLNIETVIDYKSGSVYKSDGQIETMDMERENVMKYIFSEDAWYVIRPSGTEPKIKVYIYSTDKDKHLADEKIKMISDEIDNVIESVK